MITLSDLIAKEPSIRYHKNLAVTYEVDSSSNSSITSDEFIDDFVGRWGVAYVDRQDNSKTLFKCIGQSANTLDVDRDLAGCKTVRIMPSFEVEIKAGRELVESRLVEEAHRDEANCYHTLYLICSKVESMKEKANNYQELFNHYLENHSKAEVIRTHDNAGRL